MKAAQWFTDKILPTIVLIIVLGLFSLFITVESLKQGTEEYRNSTERYRDNREELDDKQTTIIIDNKVDIAVLKERMK